MKSDFKKWLNIYKGKILTKEVIENISQHHEDEIHSTLYNEGLCLESLDTGKKIANGDDNDWSVKDFCWNIEKEFKTLRGAINYANKNN